MSQSLFQIAQRLKEVENEQKSAYWYRSIIVEMVDNFLLDLDKASNSLKALGSKSECLSSLELCSIFINDKHDICIQSFTHMDGVLPKMENIKSNELNQDEKCSLAFCSWLLHRFLRILACDGLCQLTKICLSILDSILNIARMRSAHIFQCLFLQLVQAFSDLVKVLQELYCMGRDCKAVQFDCCNVDLELVKLSVVDPSNDVNSVTTVKEAHLEFHSADSCQQLLCNIISFSVTMVCVCSHLMMALSPGILQHDAFGVGKIFSSTVAYLEDGDVQLKVAALQMICHLLKTCNILKNVDRRRCVISTVSSLIDRLLVAWVVLDKTETVMLEESTAHLIESLLMADHDWRLGSRALLHSELEELFASVAFSVAENDINSICYSQLKTMLVRLLCETMSGISVKCLTTVLRQLVVRLSTAIFHWMSSGHANDLQFAVPLISLLIYLEVTAMYTKEAWPLAGSCSVLPVEQNVYSRPYAAPSQFTPAHQVLSTSDHVPNIENTPTRQTYSRVKRRRTDAQQSTKTKRCPLFQKLVDISQEIFSCSLNTENYTGFLNAGCFLCEVSSRCASNISCTSITECTAADFVSADNVERLCSWLSTCLLSNISQGRESRSVAIGRIVHSVSSLLACYDLMAIPNDLLHELTWMLSLPWLLNDTRWLDLKPRQVKEVALLSKSVADDIGLDVITLCLQGLSIAPKECCPSWRAYVYTQALTDSRCLIRESGVKYFPMLLFRLGPHFQHLVEQCLHPLTCDPVPSVQRCLASTIGDLACVTAQTAFLNRLCLNETHDSVFQALCLKCPCCSDAGLKGVVKLINVQLFVPFMSLLKTGDIEVKKAFIKSLRSLFGHNPVNPNHPTSLAMMKDCLSLLEDADYSVRMLFSKQVTCLLSQRSLCDQSCDTTNRLVVECCKAVCDTAVLSVDHRLHATVLITVGEIAKNTTGSVFLFAILSLLENRLSSVPAVASTAFTELQDIAAFKNISSQQLFCDCKPAVCKFLVEAMLEAQASAGASNAEHILLTISATFGYADVKSYLQGCERYILPSLVSRASSEASSLIRLLTNLLAVTNRRKLITNSIKDIFTYLICHYENEDLERAINYMERETDFSLGSLLRVDFQRVHNELLLRLSICENQVFNGLRMLSLHDDQYSGPQVNNKEQVGVYLESRLLGVLAFFDAQLVNSNTAVADKKLALESLISIVQLMGSKRIGSIRHKVVNTLRLSLNFNDHSLMEVSCRAWNCFVRSLEMQLLGQMLFQIVATLLPLLLHMPRQVADIINFMVLENRSELQKYFHEIHFLPDLPELSAANDVIKQYTDNPSSQADFETQLENCIRGAQHENLDVRMHALSRLHKLFREKREALYDLILDDESAKHIISHLVSMLLHGCAEPDNKTKLLYGQCLGELGAIDPGRLQLMNKFPQEQQAGFHATVDDDNFVVGLINEMIKAFLAATEPRVQDCSAFALQSLLQVYRIEPMEIGLTECRGNKLWCRMSVQFQEILAPLLHTKYKLTADNTCSLPKPVYGTSKGQNLLDWVSNWITQLSSKVKHGLAFQVFQACSAAKRHNLQVALYILPHVVLQVLLDGAEVDHSELYNEMMEVLKWVTKADTPTQAAMANFRHVSTQTVFSVLDYLTKWRQYQVQNLTRGVAPGRALAYRNDADFKAVDGFIARIPQDTLADASFNCRTYTRGLMHFEQFISTSGEDLQCHLDFLQRLCDCLNEPDGVLGVAAVRKSHSTLAQEILVHESLGHQQDAQACYERALQVSPNDLPVHQGFLRGLMETGQVKLALFHSSGVLTENPQWMGHINQYRVEAAWKMSSWDCLDDMMRLEKTINNSWPVCVGHILTAARDRREGDFVTHMNSAHLEQMGPLSAASMEFGSYHRGYECILRLHMLSEMAEYFHVYHGFPSVRVGSGCQSDDHASSRTGLLKQWDYRLQMAQSSFRTQEPILTMRRTLQSAGRLSPDPAMDSVIGKWWLRSAKVARKAGLLQTAYGSLLQASAHHLLEFFVEKAKWLWEKDDKDSALLCLEKGMNDLFPSVPNQEAEKKVYAQAMLLYGRYCEETSNLESNEIVKRYKTVIDVCPDWELGHFQLAQYFERVMMSVMTDKDKPEKQGDLSTSLVRYFGNALMHGNQHIYQAMPRLLSLWLDYGASVSSAERKERTSRVQLTKVATMKSQLSCMNKVITQLTEQLAPYQFFSAFPQLVSRICHAQPDVSQILQQLIAQLVAIYPQQAIWMMMAVSKSSYAVRSKRCHAVFAAAKLHNSSLNKLLNDSTKLTERLIDLCDKDCGNVSTVSMSQHFRTLKRMADENLFSDILMPLQASMTVSFPSAPTQHGAHNPFSGKHVFIKGFEDTIEVLQSLQRPKKIAIVGSDGHIYIMMCKPKDDLRKDCRLMEFNAIVNRFLRKDAESRRRTLHIRTYTVTPLNEECGLVEWVKNTQGLRHIITRLYKEQGTFMSGKELKETMPALSADNEVKLKVFREKLLHRHPVVFKTWFLRTFPDPTSWYNARIAYARTLAVMSTIGYVLGLGDRHGENILFDATKGDTIHVDFNCLFNRGEKFEWPEVVPFRLTPNLVSALGPMGVEGIYRRACEVTLRVVRAQTDSLMSILKPFVYDPLVEWSKLNKDRRANPIETGEITNEQALNHVQNIEDRLRGILKTKTKPRGLPLSIEGHVKILIQEATDERNLCQMYIGWAAYM